MRLPEPVKRILVVRLADLGDLLLAEPALRSMRAGFPNAQIDLLVSPSSRELASLIAPESRLISFQKEIFDELHWRTAPTATISGVRLAYRLRRTRYDAVVILHHLTTANGARKYRALAFATGSKQVAGLDNGRGDFLQHRVDDFGFGACHEADYARQVAEIIGGASVDPAPQISKSHFEPPPGLPDRYVAIYPETGAYSRARTWPATRFAELAGALARRGIRVILLGASDAARTALTIAETAPTSMNLTGNTTLGQLIAVVRGATAVVGGDSFIGHLAAALGRPTVAIFGPSNAAAWQPYGSTIVGSHVPLPTISSITLTSGMPCAPCLYTGYALGRRDGCPTRTCLNQISVERVLAAVETVIEAAKR
jgi:ADP-heptose:LPS heptosyltransferase